ncbi:hypothetical protein J2X69_004340 [Algoriphagus sp. 4150]|nr:hypothetical protein [Algoriphagus sp. 4150]
MNYLYATIRLYTSHLSFFASLVRSPYVKAGREVDGTKIYQIL